MTRDSVITPAKSLTIAAALVATVAIFAAPKSAQALDTGAAIGIGLGSFALGTALGATASPYPVTPYGYAPPAPVYYPLPPTYYPSARSCWDPYYRRYYAC